MQHDYISHKEGSANNYTVLSEFCVIVNVSCLGRSRHEYAHTAWSMPTAVQALVAASAWGAPILQAVSCMSLASSYSEVPTGEDKVGVGRGRRGRGAYPPQQTAGLFHRKATPRGGGRKTIQLLIPLSAAVTGNSRAPCLSTILPCYQHYTSTVVIRGNIREIRTKYGYKTRGGYYMGV